MKEVRLNYLIMYATIVLTGNVIKPIKRYTSELYLDLNVTSKQHLLK